MRSPTEAADEPAPIVRRARPLLGTYVSISLQGPEAAETRRAIEAGFAAVADIHRLMSFHEPGSDVSRLNRDACDRPVEVDRRTFAVLARSTELSAESGGAFDVTVAPLLVASGFLPAPDHTSAPDPDATWRDIEFLAPDRVRYRRPLWIDLGGIAKGYAVDSAMEAIAAGPDAQCAVNAGGDLRISGPAAERVLLRAGQAPDGAVPVVEIENGSLASSSGRGFIPAKGPHIDPRQGRSIGTRSFVSVVAESCMIADGLTKIVLVRRANSGAILRKYGATAYWRNGRGAWRTLGKIDLIRVARPRGRSLKLTRPYRVSIYVIGWGVWLTGVLWVVFHYFLRVKGAFGLKANPLEEWWLIGHGGFAVAATFLFGFLWRPHIVSGWDLHWRRWSGGGLAGTTIFLILSGYALYYIGGEAWLEWTAILHWGIGIAVIALFFLHWLSKGRPKER